MAEEEVKTKKVKAKKAKKTTAEKKVRTTKGKKSVAKKSVPTKRKVSNKKKVQKVATKSTKRKTVKSAKKPVAKKKAVIGKKYKITKNKTLSTSHKAVKKQWILIDATDVVLGRLVAFLVHRLNGKHLPTYTPHTDDGDNIIVINCDKVKLTGNKELQKIYRNHSDYPGGMRERTAKEVRNGARPTDLIRIGVSRMMGRYKLGYKLVSKNLYLYAGAEHKQTAQQPKVIDFAKLNRKNVVK